MDPSLRAVTTTPSMAPSASDVTWPVSAAAGARSSANTAVEASESPSAVVTHRMWMDFMEGSLETKLFFIGGTRNPTASLPPHRKTNALSGCKVILRCFRLPDKRSGRIRPMPLNSQCCTAMMRMWRRLRRRSHRTAPDIAWVASRTGTLGLGRSRKDLYRQGHDLSFCLRTETREKQRGTILGGTHDFNSRLRHTFSGGS